MKPTLCSRCKKNLAVIFITKMENGQTTNEGLCLKCAKELGIKPVDDMISRMGLSDDDLENLNGEMGDMMNGLEGLLNPDEKDEDGEDDEQDSQTATFPFLNKLFGNAGNNNPGEALTPQKEEPRQTTKTQIICPRATSARSRSRAAISRTARRSRSINFSTSTART